MTLKTSSERPLSFARTWFDQMSCGAAENGPAIRQQQSRGSGQLGEARGEERAQPLDSGEPMELSAFSSQPSGFLCAGAHVVLPLLC